MTKILITIPWFVPAYRAGGPIQSIANLVKEYKTGVEYFIYTSDIDLNGAALEKVVTDEWLRFNAHTNVWYAAPEKISENLVKQAELLKPDIIYIVGMFSWHFNMVPLLYGKAPKKIISTRGMLHPGALSQKRWKKKIYLRVFKLLEYHQKVQFHATDDEEKRYINNYFKDAPVVFTAGNFPNKLPDLGLVKKTPGFLKLISIGIITPMKNILLVIQSLESQQAAIAYDIYGPIKDLEYWATCSAQIKKLPANITVTMHKEIEPEKIQDALSRAHVFILPSKSENFGHAIYEALSAGRPVITSFNTPWNHLQSASAGMNVPVETVKGLEEAIHFFAAMDEETLLHWHNGAIRYAAAAIDLEKIRSQYDGMFSPH